MPKIPCQIVGINTWGNPLHILNAVFCKSPDGPNILKVVTFSSEENF